MNLVELVVVVHLRDSSQVVVVVRAVHGEVLVAVALVFLLNCQHLGDQGMHWGSMALHLEMAILRCGM